MGDLIYDGRRPPHLWYSTEYPDTRVDTAEVDASRYKVRSGICDPHVLSGIICRWQDMRTVVARLGGAHSLLLLGGTLRVPNLESISRRRERF